MFMLGLLRFRVLSFWWEFLLGLLSSDCFLY